MLIWNLVTKAYYYLPWTSSKLQGLKVTRYKDVRNEAVLWSQIKSNFTETLKQHFHKRPVWIIVSGRTFHCSATHWLHQVRKTFVRKWCPTDKPCNKNSECMCFGCLKLATKTIEWMWFYKPYGNFEQSTFELIHMFHV